MLDVEVLNVGLYKCYLAMQKKHNNAFLIEHENESIIVIQTIDCFSHVIKKSSTHEEIERVLHCAGGYFDSLMCDSANYGFDSLVNELHLEPMSIAQYNNSFAPMIKFRGDKLELINIVDDNRMVNEILKVFYNVIDVNKSNNMESPIIQQMQQLLYVDMLKEDDAGVLLACMEILDLVIPNTATIECALVNPKAYIEQSLTIKVDN